MVVGKQEVSLVVKGEEVVMEGAGVNRGEVVTGEGEEKAGEAVMEEGEVRVGAAKEALEVKGEGGEGMVVEDVEVGVGEVGVAVEVRVGVEVGEAKDMWHLIQCPGTHNSMQSSSLGWDSHTYEGCMIQCCSTRTF